MRALTARDVVDVFERGRGLRPTARALALLSASEPEASVEALAELPLGERDRRLLRLRRRTLGARLESLMTCPACGEELEFSLRVDDLLGAAPAEPGESDRELVEGRLALRFRLPTSGDLMAIETEADAERARRELARRCVVEARRDGSEAAGDLSEREVAILAEAIAGADPGADLLIGLNCPSCDHRWRQPFDVATFFWTELAAEARQVLREVHALASSYGWSEADILAMSPVRRRAYLELLAE